MSSHVRKPSPNPLGDGPTDTNPLLDALHDGQVIVKESDHALTEAWYWTDEDGRIHRETFAGGPPAVHQDWGVDPLFTASNLADAMHHGRSTIRVTDRDELQERRQYRDVALAFRHLRRMEFFLRERGEIPDD